MIIWKIIMPFYIAGKIVKEMFLWVFRGNKYEQR